MPDPVRRGTGGCNLDEEGEAEKADQRQELGATAMVPTGITQILEDTFSFRRSLAS